MISREAIREAEKADMTLDQALAKLEVVRRQLGGAARLTIAGRPVTSVYVSFGVVYLSDEPAEQLPEELTEKDAVYDFDEDGPHRLPG
jgi:hypothetical protein